MINFLKKNLDFIKFLFALISVAIGTTWFISEKIHEIIYETNISMNSVHERISAGETRLSKEIQSLDKRLTVIETILMMQGHPIKGIASNNDE